MAYTLPTPADLQARHPAFAAVATPTIQAYLDDAARDVDTSWTEGDYARAIMLRACDLMLQAGIGADETQAAIGGGLASFRSGSLSGTFSDAAQRDAADGLNLYGRMFATLRRKNRPGPGVVPPATAAPEGYGVPGGNIFYPPPYL